LVENPVSPRATPIVLRTMSTTAAPAVSADPRASALEPVSVFSWSRKMTGLIAAASAIGMTWPRRPLIDPAMFAVAFGVADTGRCAGGSPGPCRLGRRTAWTWCETPAASQLTHGQLGRRVLDSGVGALWYQSGADCGLA
jgi:hypothetical protein